MVSMDKNKECIEVLCQMIYDVCGRTRDSVAKDCPEPGRVLTYMEKRMIEITTMFVQMFGYTLAAMIVEKKDMFIELLSRKE